MKLIIQIPCYNEEQTLARTIRDLPTSIVGIDILEVLIIDDGCTDNTVGVAQQEGVNHIVRHTGNRGLAAAFASGLDACLQRQADVIVNTDGDNQYCGANIVELVSPILSGDADVVLGDRQTQTVAHFSPLRKLLQRLGSMVVRRLSGTDLCDAVSGFRAFSREAAMQLNVVTSFSYTVETLIQAGDRRLRVASVPVKTNPRTRDSRLFSSVLQFITRQAVTIVRSFVMYHPVRVFLGISALLALAALVPLFFAVTQTSLSPLSLTAATVVFGVLATSSAFSALLALVTDVLRSHRRLTEMTLAAVKKRNLVESAATAEAETSPAYDRKSARRQKLRRDHGSEVIPV